MTLSLIFTLLWWAICALWGGRYIFVRKKRISGKAVEATSRNQRYKFLSYFAFAQQVILCPLTFWFSSVWLLQLHEDDRIRMAGFGLCAFANILSIYQLKHLGENYSPCFASHLPKEIIRTGPYRFIRHPSWLAKILLGCGTLLVSGSWWFVPGLIWLMMEMRQAIQIEEKALSLAFPEYEDYLISSWRLIPYVY